MVTCLAELHYFDKLAAPRQHRFKVNQIQKKPIKEPQECLWFIKTKNGTASQWSFKIILSFCCHLKIWVTLLTGNHSDLILWWPKRSAMAWNARYLLQDALQRQINVGFSLNIWSVWCFDFHPVIQMSHFCIFSFWCHAVSSNPILSLALSKLNDSWKVWKFVSSVPLSMISMFFLFV